MELKKIKVERERNKRNSFMRNKKGSVIDILIFLVLSFIIILFFASWIYGFNILTEKLTAIDGDVFGTRIGDVADDTFGTLNPIQKNGLHVLSFAMIFAMILSILISNFIVKTHPAFMIVYIFVIIGAIILSVYISNQYEDLMTNTVLGDTISEFKASSFIMLNLPIWTTIVGVFGMIILFAGIIRDAGQGGSVV